MENQDFKSYVDTFVQRVPKYGVKTKQGWRTRQKSLADPAIKAHLDRKYTIGGLAKWYPEFAILDFDDRTPEFVENVRGELELTDKNSMLMASESADSYHLIVRPKTNGKPPTAYQLNNSFKSFVSHNDIELYPRSNKIVRLPFGEFSKMVDYEYQHLDTWQDKYFWFNKLDDFDLDTVSGQQFELPFSTISAPMVTEHGKPGGWYSQGADLLVSGLQATGTRHESQAKVIYNLWRRNVPLDETARQVWQWILKHHNGFSKDIQRFQARVKDEIHRQAGWIYSNFKWAGSYPDSTHNSQNGYITKLDVFNILQVCKGSIPRSRFLFHIVKYCYPRRYMDWVNIRAGTQLKDRDKGYSNDTLTSWASGGTYTRYLNELESMGVLKRNDIYVPGVVSKGIHLDWNYKPDDAVLYEGRSLDTFAGTVNLLFEPQDFRDLLRATGATRTGSINAINRIFGGVTKRSSY